MGDEEKYDLMSICVVAIVSIVCVTLLSIGLAPAAVDAARATPSSTPESPNVAGKAFDYGSSCVPVTAQFDFSDFDFNGDGRLDFYDYVDVLAGKVDCTTLRCDLDGDGSIDGRDKRTFDLLVTRLYDFNADMTIDRTDAQLLAEVLRGNRAMDANHVYDLDHDGLLCKSDLTLFTSLQFNYDIASQS